MRLYDLADLSLTGVMLTLGMLSVPFTVFSIVGATNALDLIDGTDGLAGTFTVLALLALMVMAGLAGRNELLQISTCLAGAVSAFLAFNLPSAQPRRGRVFLGDAGSTLLGYVLACLLIASSQGEHRVYTPVIALLLLTVPLQDTVAVMVRRLASGRPLLHADRTHLHHLALSAGLSQQRTLCSSLARVELTDLYQSKGGKNMERRINPAYGKRPKPPPKVEPEGQIGPPCA